MSLIQSVILVLSSAALLSAADVLPANWTPGQKLVFYTVNGNIQEFTRLTKSGANLQFRDSSPGSEGETLLIKAATYGHVNLAKVLLDAGLDINATDERGETALLSACFAKQKEMAKWLVERGADVNKPSKNGLTPLHVAADKDEPELVTLLIRAGAKQQPSANGFTPIMAAAQRSTSSLSILINAGGDIDADRRDGRRAVHFASLNTYRYQGGTYTDENDFVALSMLLERGSDLSKKDKKGETFLDFVHRRYNGLHLIGILKLILKFQPDLLLKNPKPLFVRKLYDTYFGWGYPREKLDFRFLKDLISKSPGYASPSLDEDGFSITDRVIMELLKKEYRNQRQEVDMQLEESLAFLEDQGISAPNENLIRQFGSALKKNRGVTESRPASILRNAMIGSKEEDLQKLLAIYSFLNEDEISAFHEYVTDRNILLYQEVSNPRYIEYLCWRRKEDVLIDYYHRFQKSGIIPKSFYESMLHYCGVPFLEAIKQKEDKTITPSEMVGIAIRSSDYKSKLSWINKNYPEIELVIGYQEALSQFSGYYQNGTFEKLLFFLRQKPLQATIRTGKYNLIGNLLDLSCAHGFKQFWAEEVLILIKNLNALGLDINGNSDANEPPIMTASRCGSRYLVRKLLDAGADPDTKSRAGLTALHYVLGGANAGVYPRKEYGNESPEISKSIPQIPNTAALIAQLLALKTNDVNLKNGNGYTPLMLAVRCGRLSIVKVLLERGADATLKNRFGETAYDLAFYWNQTAILRELDNYTRIKNRPTYLAVKLLTHEAKGMSLDLRQAEISPDLNRYLLMNKITILNAERKAVEFSAGTDTCYILELMRLRRPEETINALKDGYSPNCFSGPWVGNNPLAFAFWEKDPILLEILLHYGARPTINGKPIIDQVTVIDKQLKAEQLIPEIMKEKLMRMKSIIKRYGN